MQKDETQGVELTKRLAGTYVLAQAPTSVINEGEEIRALGERIGGRANNNKKKYPIMHQNLIETPQNSK